jgi:hypothetical protein
VAWRRATAAGRSPATQLHTGFGTSAAAEHGASLFKITDVTSHRSVNSLRGYVRRADGLKDPAGAAFL